MVTIPLTKYGDLDKSTPTVIAMRGLHFMVESYIDIK